MAELREITIITVLKATTATTIWWPWCRQSVRPDGGTSQRHATSTAPPTTVPRFTGDPCTYILRAHDVHSYTCRDEA